MIFINEIRCVGSHKMITLRNLKQSEDFLFLFFDIKLNVRCKLNDPWLIRSQKVRYYVHLISFFIFLLIQFKSDFVFTFLFYFMILLIMYYYNIFLEFCFVFFFFDQISHLLYFSAFFSEASFLSNPIFICILKRIM